MRRSLQKKRHDPTVKEAIKKISAVIREKQAKYFIDQQVQLNKRMMQILRK
mgnify:CR=1 FL=1